jgi:hypothetical protein
MPLLRWPTLLARDICSRSLIDVPKLVAVYAIPNYLNLLALRKLCHVLSLFVEYLWLCVYIHSLRANRRNDVAANPAVERALLQASQRSVEV